MKILLVTPIHWHDLWTKQQAEELAQYGQVRTPLVIGQGQYFWRKALLGLGHDVEVHRYSDPTPLSERVPWADRVAKWIPFPGRRLRNMFLHRDIILRNQRTIDTAKQYQPDIIIITAACQTIGPETVRSLKECTRAKLALTDGTSPVAFARPEQKVAVPFYYCVFTNDFYHSVQFLELGAQKAVALPVSACDPDYHRRYELTPEEKNRYACDICFVGALTPRGFYAERVRILESLADFDLGIWSDDEALVRSRPRLGRCYRGRAYGTEMIKILSATKIALNAHGCFMQWGGNMRTFEIPATGAFQLIDRYDPAWFEEDEEVLRFQDTNDLVSKVRYYLEHNAEREAIAKRGQARVYRDHTYVARMSRLLEWLDG